MYKPTYSKRTVRLVAWVCGAVFAVFSLLYLYVMQADLLAAAQHLLSKGQTTYYPLWDTLVITLLLVLLKGVYRRVISYPLRFHALYYFPSCLVLGLLTSIVPQREWSVQISVHWGALFLWLAAYAAVSWAALHFPDRTTERHGIFSFLWVNFLCLAVLFCMACSLGDTSDVYHYRLKVARHLTKGRNDKALQVGGDALQADRSLTAMRAFALSREGLLADRLFEYPQLYGSDGLIPEASDTVNVYDWTTELYKHLGGKPGAGIHSATRFLELLSELPSATEAVPDYLLCAYLLDKDLDAFVGTLPRFREVDASLPVCYKEALALYARLHTSPAIAYQCEEVEANLNDFIHFEAKYADKTERANQCRSMYGSTYWWYYYYQRTGR